ncbi:hypothetical protein H9P43_007112 [Blastocladiella emersonii ATCC 22665]|nr:hypothetical protein H9P43_007112 [Blastocladiella emersonii ATCC 22665]
MHFWRCSLAVLALAIALVQAAVVGPMTAEREAQELTPLIVQDSVAHILRAPQPRTQTTTNTTDANTTDASVRLLILIHVNLDFLSDISTLTQTWLANDTLSSVETATGARVEYAFYVTANYTDQAHLSRLSTLTPSPRVHLIPNHLALSADPVPGHAGDKLRALGGAAPSPILLSPATSPLARDAYPLLHALGYVSGTPPLYDPTHVALVGRADTYLCLTSLLRELRGYAEFRADGTQPPRLVWTSGFDGTPAAARSGITVIGRDWAEFTARGLADGSLVADWGAHGGSGGARAGLAAHWAMWAQVVRVTWVSARDRVDVAGREQATDWTHRAGMPVLTANDGEGEEEEHYAGHLAPFCTYAVAAIGVPAPVMARMARAEADAGLVPAAVRRLRRRVPSTHAALSATVKNAAGPAVVGAGGFAFASKSTRCTCEGWATADDDVVVVV